MTSPTHQPPNRRSVSRKPRPSQSLAALASSQLAPLEDVLITSKLRTRRRRPNAEDENTALRALARVMAEKPGELLDTLLTVALELCEAGTAGLSVLENTSAHDKIFRWTNLVGAMQSHIGGATPREFSPCGVTVDRNSPQLFLYPARRFHYFKAIEPAIIEALVMPVHMGDEIPATLWIVSHDPRVHFDAEDVRVLTALADFTSSALRLSRSRELEKSGRLAAGKELVAHQKIERSMHNVQAGMEADAVQRTLQLQHLSARLIASQDEERRRLARNLHDSAGQYLAAILMNLGAARRHADPTEKDSKIAEAIEMAGLCNSEIRTISYLLHPPLLDEMGLGSAISMYAEGFAERSGVTLDLQIPKPFPRLPSEIETTLFRVVQQSLANIHRHSGSPSARIVVTLNEHSVTVDVTDAGRGIPTRTLEQFNTGRALLGVGISGMRERIRDMQGQFSISSTNQGTTVHASLPIS